MKKIAVLGSTGSIGTSSLDVVRAFPQSFCLTALSVYSNIDLLEQQIREFNISVAAVVVPEKAAELQSRVGGLCTVYAGTEGLKELTATADYDVLIGAMVGFAGLAPTLEAIKRGKRIALANKETLVVAGELVTELCKQYGAELLPVDSEHSALFQCLTGEESKFVRRLILTASGGPFRNKTREELFTVSVAEALNHPTWKMGSKITIDSASLMNKGLEVIEARWLFGTGPEKIAVVVHPQSIVHSMVEFTDGSIKAQLSTPDMKLPIQYALSYPDRLERSFVETNFPLIGSLTFTEPDLETFRCLKMAYEVLSSGGTTPCILNAANEIAVDRFLKGQIGFMQIPEIIGKSLEKVESFSHPDLETLFECDKITRKFAESLVF